MQVRRNYADETEVVPQGRLFLSCNDLPPITPADAMQFMHVFQTDFRYVDAREQERERASGRDVSPDKRPGDPEIKNFCGRADVRDAFVHMVSDAYAAAPVEPSARVRTWTERFRADAKDEETLLRESFAVTGDAQDCMTSAEVAEMVRGLKINASAQKVRMTLERMGAENCNKVRHPASGKYVRGFRGLSQADGGERVAQFPE